MIKANKKIVLYLMIIIVAAVCVNALCFGYEIHSKIIRADQWRFLELYLIPFYNGTLELNMLFSDSHPQPLAAILFICSAQYFDLTVNLYHYVGIISKLLFLNFLLFLVYKNFKMQNIWLLFIVSIAIATTFFSLKSINEYAWPLVTLGNFAFMFYLILLYFADKFYKETNKITICMLLCFSIFLILVSKDFATIGFAALVTIMLFICLREKKYKNLFLFISIVLSGFLTNKLFYLLINVEQLYKSELSVNLSSYNCLGMMNSYAIGFFNGLVSLKFLKTDVGLSDFSILLIGYIFLIFYSLVLVVYLKKQLYQKSLIPAVLMIFSYVFITAVALFRYVPEDSGINWLVASPRYTRVYEIGVLGMFWALLLIFNSLNINKIKITLFSFFFIFIVLLNTHFVLESWKHLKYSVRAQMFAETALKNKEIENIPIFVKGSFFSKDKMEFLEQKGLNVYSDKYKIK